jgi:hypothetical protein
MALRVASSSAPGLWPEAYSLPFAAVTSTNGVAIDGAQVMGPTKSLLGLVYDGKTEEQLRSFWSNLSFTAALLPGSQSAIRISGKSGARALAELNLRTTLRVRGAVVRTTTEALCRLTTEPNLNLPRTCAKGGTGPFTAFTYFNWPPMLPASSGHGSSARQKTVLTQHSRDAHRLNKWLGQGSAQVGHHQFGHIVQAFAAAAAELPQPFAIVECALSPG